MSQDHQKAPSFDWVFWLQWVLVSTLGWVLGLIIGTYGFGIGITLGTLQWLILRSRVRQADRWIWVSTVGWIIGLLVISLLPDGLGVLAGLLLGAFLGGAQWLVLRRWVYQAGWWVVLNALAWVAGPMFGDILVGAVVGAVTGVAMELYMRNPRPTARKTLHTGEPE